jgi:hypothetical protein
MKCSNNRRDKELLLGLLLKYVAYAFMIFGLFFVCSGILLRVLGVEYNCYKVSSIGWNAATFGWIGNYYHAVLFRQSHDKDDKSD